jgi:hypothetical protein
MDLTTLFRETELCVTLYCYSRITDNALVFFLSEWNFGKEPVISNGGEVTFRERMRMQHSAERAGAAVLIKKTALEKRA